MKLVNFWEKSYRHREGLGGIHAIYINNLMRTLAWSLAGLFSPLYIFFLGYEQGGLIAGLKVVILAMVVERSLVMLLSLPLGKLVFRLGFKWSILLGSFLLSIYFLLPSIFPRSILLIVVMSVVAAFEILIYWIARLSIMSLDGEKSHYGHDISFLAITERLVSILGPFVGGYLVTRGGFASMFAVVTVVSIISALPIFFIRDHKITDGISFSGLVEFLKNEKNRHLNIAFFGQGLNNAIDGFFWPIYFFLVLKSYELIGGVTTVVTGLTILVVYLAGRRFDRLRALGGDEDEKSFTLATWWMALLTVIRPFFGGVMSLISYDLVVSLSGPFWWISYDSYLYSAGKRFPSPLAFYAYREVIYSVGRFSVVLLLFFVLDVIPVNLIWWVLFGLSGLGIALANGMKKES